MHGFSSLASMVGSVTAGLDMGRVSAVLMYISAIVFAISGATKLLDPSGTAGAIRKFSGGRLNQLSMGYALGVAELVLAAALAALIPWAAFVAASVLWLFTVLLASNVISGNKFDCHCFGEHSGVISWNTVLRTTILAIGATIASLGASRAAQGALRLHAAEAAMAAAVVGAAVIAAVGVQVFRMSRTTLTHLRGVS